MVGVVALSGPAGGVAISAISRLVHRLNVEVLPNPVKDITSVQALAILGGLEVELKHARVAHTDPVLTGRSRGRP